MNLAVQINREGGKVNLKGGRQEGGHREGGRLVGGHQEGGRRGGAQSPGMSPGGAREKEVARV